MAKETLLETGIGLIILALLVSAIFPAVWSSIVSAFILVFTIALVVLAGVAGYLIYSKLSE